MHSFFLEDWDDVVVTKVNVPVTLACSDPLLQGKFQLEWQWRPDDRETWSLVLSANQKKQSKGGASKPDTRLADSNFNKSGDFSLHFKPRAKDGGRYTCSVVQGGMRKRQVTLLVILTGNLSPLALPPSLLLSHRLYLGHRLSLSDSSQSAGVTCTVPKCHLAVFCTLLREMSPCHICFQFLAYQPGKSNSLTALFTK